jgi:hypothetical protein
MRPGLSSLLPAVQVEIESGHTFGEVVDCEFARWITAQMPQCDVWLALADHEVHYYERLEDDCPGAVS